jgi:hypothetical protein
MIFSMLFSLICLPSVFAAPLISLATPEPENRIQILNFKGEKIFSATTDAVKRIELRDGFAVVQGLADNVTLIKEDGTRVIENVYGSEILISKNLMAIYLKNGNGAVYTLEGKKIFPHAGESTRPVKEIKIANRRFLVTDYFTDTLRIFDDSGNELTSFRGIQKARISDGFIALTSVLGSEMLLGESVDEILSTEPAMKKLQLTDEFAGYFDIYDNFRLFSREAGAFPLMNSVNQFELTNYFAIVKMPVGISVYGKKAEELEFLNSMTPSMVTSHAILAYRSVTGALTVKNMVTGESLTVNQAGDFQMSDDVLLTRNGSADLKVYSLRSGRFGSLAFSAMNPLFIQSQVGNGLVSIQGRYFDSKFYDTTVFGISDQGIKRTLVDDLRANRVNLSVNREEWNWQ